MNFRSVFFVTLLLFCAVSARAEIFTAYLTPVQEVPPTNPTSSATGYARVNVNEAAGTLTFVVVFNNLTSAQILSHIHAPAAIGANAAVAINFGTVGGTSGTISGSAAITPTQLAQIRAHMGYVNVHSTNFPNGEIRGQLGAERPLDTDGDGRTDFSVLRFPNASPAPITYWNLNSTTGQQVVNWGEASTDFPAPGDYDGDGITDIALYRSGQTVGAQGAFFVLRSSDNTAFVLGYGVNGDQPVARDYDGDGKTDPAVYRRGATLGSQAVFWIRQSSTGGDSVIPWGLTGDPNDTSTGDTPVVADYDGDGKVDVAVYRTSGSPANTFFVRQSSNGALVAQTWGNFASDWIVPGDYDGDGKADFAVARVNTPMEWWIMLSSGGVRVQQFGLGSDLPAQGDYDGDARTDMAVFRQGATASTQNDFWVFNSFSQTATDIRWGLGADFPTNTFDIR